MDEKIFNDHFLLPQSSLYFLTEQIIERMEMEDVNKGEKRYRKIFLH